MTVNLEDYIGDDENFDEIVNASSEDDHELMTAAQKLYNYYDATRDCINDESKENNMLFADYEKKRKEFAKKIIKNFLEMTFEK